MNTASILQRALQALLITGVLILAQTSAHAADAPHVAISGSVQIPWVYPTLIHRGKNDE